MIISTLLGCITALIINHKGANINVNENIKSNQVQEYYIHERFRESVESNNRRYDESKIDYRQKMQ